MATKTFDEQLASYDAQLARLRARKQASISRHGQEERKARNHACMVAGGLVLSCFPDGWQSIDWGQLSAFVEHNGSVFGQHTTEILPTPEASRRLRTWEHGQQSDKDEDDYEEDTSYED